MAGSRKRRRDDATEQEQEYTVAVWRRERQGARLKAELKVVRKREEGKNHLLLVGGVTLGVVLLVVLADRLKAFVDTLGKLVGLSVLGTVWLAHVRKCVPFFAHLFLLPRLFFAPPSHRARTRYTR